MNKRKLKKILKHECPHLYEQGQMEGFERCKSRGVVIAKIIEQCQEEEEMRKQMLDDLHRNDYR